MGKKKAKKTTAPNDIDAATWRKIGLWLADHVHDIEIDAEQIDEEQGADLMPALRGLVDHLLAGGTLADGAEREKAISEAWARFYEASDDAWCAAIAAMADHRDIAPERAKREAARQVLRDLGVDVDGLLKKASTK